MDPTPFILKTALISSSLVFCPTPRDVRCPATDPELTIYSHAPQGVPVVEWPESRERPETPHLPHEERWLRVSVDSGASGGIVANSTSRQSTYTSGVTQLALLPGDWSDKFILVSEWSITNEQQFLATLPELEVQARPNTKKHLSTGSILREIRARVSRPRFSRPRG